MAHTSGLTVHFTVKEVAASLKVSEWSIYREIERGALRAMRIGKAIRISPEQLEAYKAGQNNQPAPNVVGRVVEAACK